MNLFNLFKIIKLYQFVINKDFKLYFLMNIINYMKMIIIN